MIADMVVWLLQRTALDLLMTPVSKAEEDRVSGPLPVPMIQGGYAVSRVLAWLARSALQSLLRLLIVIWRL